MSIIYIPSQPSDQVDPEVEKDLLQEANWLGREMDRVKESHLRAMAEGSLQGHPTLQLR